MRPAVRRLGTSDHDDAAEGGSSHQSGGMVIWKGDARDPAAWHQQVRCRRMRNRHGQHSTGHASHICSQAARHRCHEPSTNEFQTPVMASSRYSSLWEKIPRPCRATVDRSCSSERAHTYASRARCSRLPGHRVATRWLPSTLSSW
jgi:hypothetical protein